MEVNDQFQVLAALFPGQESSALIVYKARRAVEKRKIALARNQTPSL
jgi:hypothetical protein